jgi:hypothetical protein
MNQKIEKKYTSKAAISYRTVLAKLVDNEAIQRGEDSATSSTGGTSNSDDTMSGKSLLESLNMMDDEEMKQKMLSATRPSSTVGVAVAKAVPVSQLPGAKGRLMTPPSSGNAPTLTQIRKPASSSSSTSSGNALNLLKKKPSGSSKAVALKMGSNKLSNNNMTNGTATSDDHIEDIETSFKNMAEEEKSVTAAAAAVAAAAQAAVEVPVVAAAVTTVPTQTTTAITNGSHTTTHTGPAHLSPVNNAPKQSLADSIAKMKAQNGDFFGGL